MEQTKMQTHTSSNKQPVKKFRSGTVSVAVWEQKGSSKEYDSTFYTVSSQKSYKDKDGEWKNGESFNEGDVPVLTLLLNEAYKWIRLEARQKDKDSGD